MLEFYSDGTPNYNNFPTERCERGNPNHQCVSCKITLPQINGRLEGHASNCAWRKMIEMEIRVSEIARIGVDLQTVPTDALWRELQRREANGVEAA